MSQKNDTLSLLLNKGLLTGDQMKAAQEEVTRTGLSLEKALEKLGYITEEEIACTKADILGVPYLDLNDYLIDQGIIALVPEAMARRHRILPLFKIGQTLTIAMADPQDVVAIDAVRSKAHIDSIDTVLVSERGLQKAVDAHYGTRGSVDDVVKGIDHPRQEQRLDAADGLVADDEGEASVIKLVNLVISQAVRDKASDIHIEPEDDLVRIRYRVDGILREVNTIPKHLQGPLISRIKILSKMDIAEQRRPQDGRMELRREDRAIDIRVSSFPTVHGENVVMRLLDKSTALLGLAELGMCDRDLKRYEKCVHYPNGIILVTGPTGSGKTTTLYASLVTINSLEKNIITIEDPIEYELPLIRQTQVNVKAGLTFGSGLRSMLRQDPDVMMVGEIRDKETADVAIQASLTGHLVFSTLHTNNAAGALTRLVEMGVEPFLIASSVAAVLAQRLVRVICARCKEEYVPAAELLRDLNLADGAVFYRGAGCEQCKQSGFAGRTALFELLLIDEEVRKAVTAKASADRIGELALAQGMTNLFTDGVNKALAGITTIDEVLRVTKIEGM